MVAISNLDDGYVEQQGLGLGGALGVPGTSVGVVPPAPLTATDLQAILDEFAALVFTSFLTNTGGGEDVVQAHGTLGATETIDLALGNDHWGTLDQDCTISTTGWTNGRGCKITVEIHEDATGGWTPTFSGVTWIGGTPTWVTTASTVTHVVLFSRDGGTTIWGGVLGDGTGGGGGSPNLDGGLASSTYGGITAIDAGGA